MANYCSNSVRFIGSEQAVADVAKLFRAIQEQQTQTGRYHLPDFVNVYDQIITAFQLGT